MDPERWRKIEALYEAARGVDAARRAAVLEEGCGGDESLRREVESLLAHGENAGRFMEVPALAMLPEAARPAVGQRISHYQIQEKLGEGGMGVVYKAEDTRLHRTVALKFIRPDVVEDRGLKARFLTEAEAAAALIHPNICVVHEIDEADGMSSTALGTVKAES